MSLIPQQPFVTLLEKGIEKDLKLIVRGEPVEVHKILLEVYSPVFKKMFDGKFKVDNTLDHDPVIFSKFIDLLYSKTPEYTFEEYIELINLADYYQIELLMEKLPVQLESKLTKENVYDAYIKINHTSSKEVCLRVLSEHLLTTCDNKDNSIISQITNENDIIKCLELCTKSNVIKKKYAISDLEIVCVNIIKRWLYCHHEDKKDRLTSFQKMKHVVNFDNYSVELLVNNFNWLTDNLFFTELEIHEVILKKLYKRFEYTSQLQRYEDRLTSRRLDQMLGLSTSE